MHTSQSTAKKAFFLGAYLVLAAAAAVASPLTALSPAEQDYHDKIFDYVMETVVADKAHDWASYSGKGKITAGQPFLSRSKANCREFTEEYDVGGKPGRSKGYGCRRSDGAGWCRLKTNQEILSCALENPGFRFGGTGSYGATTSYNAPNVNGPDMPDVNVGNVSGPNVNVNVDIDARGVRMPNFRAAGGGGNNRQQQQQQGDQKNLGTNNGRGEASGAAYSVTDTLGSGAAKGTGMAIGWFNDWFR